jgi:hypothetical protein
MFSNYIMLFMSLEVIQQKYCPTHIFPFLALHLIWQMPSNVRITLNFQKIFSVVMTAEEEY